MEDFHMQQEIKNETEDKREEIKQKLVNTMTVVLSGRI